MKKKGPMILLLSLISLLIFIFGVYYGKSIAKVDALDEEFVKRFPTPTEQSKGSLSSIGYETFLSPDCGVRFTYPAYLEVEKSPTKSANLKSSNGNEHISIDCTDETRQNYLKMLSLGSFKSESLTIDGELVDVYTDDKNDQTVFLIPSRETSFALTHSLFSLLRHSLTNL
ncbi:hypothetical protein KC726_02540 [Candidatus Woesebacteria bacterium]|nr:hypothetical protein [Candidatus Woesebacteria bacterium]